MYEIQKYFTDKAHGGYSTCTTDLDHPWWAGSTISNCVGLVWGLFNLDRGMGKNFKRIENCHAKDIYPRARKTGSGYLVNTAPKSSSIACYNVGEYGHVVYLLWVWKSGAAVGIESNYSGDISNKKLLRVKFGNPKRWYSGYQGCVYDFYPKAA